ncbi:hypothetical protein [Sinobaca sp. H24]|uniref:hypothetical protein n=1 Tax=Sinobaca sp. H24 TaxID=2923376 RepID=UPI0020798CF6|nr:hypothetical protein [Sinobaca sp. H24]
MASHHYKKQAKDLLLTELEETRRKINFFAKQFRLVLDIANYKQIIINENDNLKENKIFRAIFSMGYHYGTRLNQDIGKAYEYHVSIQKEFSGFNYEFEMLLEALKIIKNKLYDDESNNIITIKDLRSDIEHLKITTKRSTTHMDNMVKKLNLGTLYFMNDE